MYFPTKSVLPLLLIASTCPGVHSHGYLASPRSRNFIANQEGSGWNGGDTKYPRETCPHCLNRGGTAGQCGITGGTSYDYPLSYDGNLMPANPQAQYSQGQVIDVDILLTAHHMGHFEFFACPIQHGDIPTGDCFQEFPLEFVSDELYGAPKDINYPNRAYIAPRGVANRATVGLTGEFYRFRLKLPDNLSGDLVLLQWHYLTANSCKFPGYDTYPFPGNWGNMQNSLGICGSIPADGNGVPEQFWNCAEISISNGPVAPTTPAPVPVPSPPTPTMPYPSAPPVPAPTPTVAAPTPIGSGTCGSGNIGNGICANSGLCCSKWGHCGSSSAHCDNPAPLIPPPTPSPEAPIALTPPVYVTSAPVDATSAPVNPTPLPETSAPVPSPTAPPVQVTTAPVVEETPPPVDPTPAPIEPTPTPPIDGPNWEEWVVSTEPRCGTSEADARGNCRPTCSSVTDCDEGQACWPVFANYCGSKPEPSECTGSDDRQPRCGVSEIVARETCGMPCNVWYDCDSLAGESCFLLHPNFCECEMSGARRKLLRGKSSK